MNRVKSAGLTDIGKKRKANQDAFFLDDRLGLYVVADGMGGHKGGEVASQMVVESIRDAISDSQNSEKTPHEDTSLSPTAGRLLDAISFANQKVYRASLKNEELKGMGSTVSTIFLNDRVIIGANVGDSPIYLIHRNQIDEISVAHTLAAMQAAVSGGEPDKASHHILTRAIGVQETVEPHVCEVPCFPGDILVIGSDGLSNKVAKEEIRMAAQSMPPDKACRYLVDLANLRGGEDNITALITKIGSTSLINNWVVKPLINFFRKTFSGFRNNR